MVHDPLSPSEALRTRGGAALAALALLVLVYGVLIVAELLLAVLVAGSLTAGAYLSYRTFAVLDAVADAAQRFADATEREADAAANGDASSGTEPTRPTERDR
ncbi:hypothetical protein [Halorubrum halodurans]|uniref:Uncharacterized protein n=1 Tax=Halorubrum halodurans TaxID=1383851 RepID=A0A256ISC2_9EURY|nr:hypothetical protein [Halorubrum halodurans]OYR59425.1 hypothetical protein DJ70_00185 [Halorubrum halodurans]